MGKSSMRMLVAVGLVVMLLLSWYSLISDAIKNSGKYESYLTTAREKAQLGLYEDAQDYYAAALKQQDSIDLRDEIAEFYQAHSEDSNYEAFCESLIADYPDSAIGYERLAEYYKKTGAYYSCFSMIKNAAKRGVPSKVLDGIAAELAYAYELKSTSFRDVGTYSAGFCAVYRKVAVWGFTDVRGDLSVPGKYLYAAPFSSAGVAPVQLEDGRFALIDTTGRLKSLDAEGKKIEACTSLISNKMAVKYEGKYHYCDSAFKELFGAYDYAGAFYCGVAAVMDGGKWAIIDEEGKKVTDFIFEDIKIDDKGIAFRDDRALAKLNGVYILIDTKGKQVGRESWEDADAFNADMLAAVKKDGLWGYINSSGKTEINYQYVGAQSFANGMAAVQIDGLWGYIGAEDYKIKIEPAFNAARDFSQSGTAYVNDEGQWFLLRIYRLK